MSKLKLSNIQKIYETGGTKVEALKGISIDFRNNEFVSILGPSGCGKTTMLNIIGGLDRYTNGDLMINGVSTRAYKDTDWDTYRNHSIGFVFQNYNLISHQTILQNVEISMTLSGVQSSERKNRATEALRSVGLIDQIYKKPNQLSGGQMQRVAIARALVNNPDIILADEPTGALDSVTSIQIMDLLREISKEKLVIMVTHNGEIAEEYSSRIIRFKDGQILSDSNPVIEETIESINKQQDKKKKSSMSYMTALTLSFKNLLTKKGRTFLTAFAGSIGIIGVSLVLALSNGLSTQINELQSNALSGFPISITTITQKADFGPPPIEKDNGDEKGKFTKENVIYSYEEVDDSVDHKNLLTEEFFNYVEDIKIKLPDSVNAVSYQKAVSINLLAKGNGTVVKFDPSSTSKRDPREPSDSFWQELPEDAKFINSQYDLIGTDSRLPETKNEIALVVNEFNQINKEFFKKLGYTSDNNEFKLEDFIGKTILKVVPNNEFYTKTDAGLYVSATAGDFKKLYDKDTNVELTITGLLRIKEGVTSGYLNHGFVYTSALTNYIVSDASKSDIAIDQKGSDVNVLTGARFADDASKEMVLKNLGADTTPTGINIYPTNFDSKDEIKKYLDKYNKNKSVKEKIVYTDLAESISNMMGTILKTVTSVLVGFAAISLIVSTIMISIITYVSVIERTKEIGILRSVGARKKDITRVFNAETIIIGAISGSFGVMVSYVLSFPINSVISKISDFKNVADLSPLAAISLIVGSVILTLFAGLIPARMAAKKDPVIALRTE
jgi:putative ABC transport system permease protein